MTDKSALNAVPMLTQDKLIFFLEMRVCFPNETLKLWILLTTTTLPTLTPLRRKKTGAHTEAEEEDTAIWMPSRQCDSQKSHQPWPRLVPRQKGTLMKVHVCCMLMLFTCLSCAAAMFGKFAGASRASTATELQSQHKQALDLLF